MAASRRPMPFARHGSGATGSGSGEQEGPRGKGEGATGWSTAARLPRGGRGPWRPGPGAHGATTRALGAACACAVHQRPRAPRCGWAWKAAGQHRFDHDFLEIFELSNKNARYESCR
jgi:hypothetical protein